jgi:hypothetical protein
MALYRQGKLPPSRMTEVDVAHDDWCGIYRGGYCNWGPDIRFRLPPGAEGIRGHG